MTRLSKNIIGRTGLMTLSSMTALLSWGNMSLRAVWRFLPERQICIYAHITAVNMLQRSIREGLLLNRRLSMYFLPSTLRMLQSYTKLEPTTAILLKSCLIMKMEAYREKLTARMSSSGRLFPISMRDCTPYILRELSIKI
ncbi:hypothetical protein SDC9_175198 [bioreactor metagenome]|uniref:Uncharacterized protein n=1 Tax=bioreactor metagenome TaxID=1076179 RepID=A0A645GUQ6_9ZZZZ